MECLRRVAYVLSSEDFKLPASSTKSHVYISYSETSTDMYIARVDGFRNSEITFTKILELYYSSSVYLFSVGFMQSSIYSAEMFSRVFLFKFWFSFWTQSIIEFSDRPFETRLDLSQSKFETYFFFCWN